MALLSPGVQVSVIDQSNYIPAATNSVPYILLATASNKISGAGVGIATGTLAANANKTYLITSQRDLSATFGVPFFYKTAAGTPINGYELNEYGLLAAYSALGVTNQCYVQRVDIDLSELTASLTRPTGNPNDGTYWFNTASTQWGIFQWNQTTAAFTNQVPSVITNTEYLEPSSTVPLQSYGSISDYAVTATNTTNPLYYKRGGPTELQTSNTSLSDLYNTWVLVGSTDWQTAWPTIQGTLAPATLTASNAITINGSTVAVPAATNNTVQGLSDAINSAGITGVYSAYTGGQLQIYADETAQADTLSVTGASGDGTTATITFASQSVAPYAVGSLINIAGVTPFGYNGLKVVTGCTTTSVSYVSNTTASYISGGTVGSPGTVSISNQTGTPLTALGITAGQYLIPTYYHGPSYSTPRWRTTDTAPEPTGSIWFKTNNVNLGANLAVSKYNATLGAFVPQNVQIFSNDAAAIYGLDPSGGGINIPVGTVYGEADPYHSQITNARGTGGVLLLQRYTSGPTVITGNNTAPGPFTSGNSFSIQATEPGTSATTSAFATLTGTTAADFVSAVSAAGVPNVSASIAASGAIVFTHATGGDIVMSNTTGTPLTTAGINTSCVGVRQINVNGQGLILSNWTTAPVFTYTASTTAPDQNPANGRLWYYSAVDQVDIMIQNNGEWLGYQNCTNDVRGYDLSLTNASGPQISPTAPTTQNDAALSPLQPGDLWIDTSDLENYPMINRWENVNGQDQWVTINNTDQTTENGVLFADARWAPNGTTDPISDPLPTIVSLLTSDYLDLDAPSTGLYPQGILLFNTRRSGFNVKQFEVDYFNAASYPYPDVLPTVTNAWVTASGNRADGSPYMGRQAQRALIVQALKGGIDSNTTIREDQNIFNLIACPQYPELAPNMVALNDDRNDTAFVIVDTPLRLSPAEVVTWSTNNNGTGLPTGDGLLTNSSYSAAFYPSCQTTDLSGSTVVQPPSHMMVRTVIRSDSISYPWLAPAGTRRGVVDNAFGIGYVNAATGEFMSTGVNQGLRDILYQYDINPITFVPGVGITNFGNHTLQATASALDRINVARLVAYLRGRLQQIGRNYLFEPNDAITRTEMTNSVNSLMIDLVNKRGIYDYLVVCDLSNNTPARIDANELYVDIAIEPVKAIEFIYIPLRIQNTGTIAAQTTA